MQSSMLSRRPGVVPTCACRDNPRIVCYLETIESLVRRVTMHLEKIEMNQHYLMLYSVVFMFISFDVFSASFDCNKASTEMEKSICNNRSLNLKDTELGDAYWGLGANFQLLNLKNLKKDNLRGYKKETPHVLPVIFIVCCRYMING